MAEQAFATNKLLNFIYKIPTGKFSKRPFTASSPDNDGCHYKADIVVNRHSDFPNIPPSTWTITLVIMDSDGDIWVNAELKEGPESLKNPSLFIVVWKFRMPTMEMGDRYSGDWVHIGFKESKRERCRILGGLVGERSSHAGGRRISTLIRDPQICLMVNLMFIYLDVEKTTTCSVLETLYESSLLADCKLVCGAREFPAHRAILAAQSPVFAAMFQNDMKEKSSGICTIKDIRPDIMDALLQFVYTKGLSKADGKLEALWTAADKYDMQELKQECERWMLKSVTDDNAFEYLCFAKKRGLKRLKVEAAKIISQESL